MKPNLQDAFLNQEMNTLASYIAYRDSLNSEVSKVPVAWHLDHMLLTINGIYQVLDSSDSKNYKRRFNFGRAMMFTFNKIPRGRAESPAQVRPADSIHVDSIYRHFEMAEHNLKLLEKLPEKAHFTHPYIGMLNRDQTKRFLKIHTNHHLDIISDILNEEND